MAPLRDYGPHRDRRSNPSKPMTWTGRALAALAVAAALTVACGGSPSNSSAKSSPTPTKAAQITSVDACSLVTSADASTATGATLTNLAAGTGASVPGACIYGSQDSQASVLVFAQTYPDTTTADSVSPDQLAAVMNGQYGISNAKPVTGIGDKAFEYTATSAGGGGIVIFVFKSNVVLLIAVSPASDPSKVEALARIAVANLPKS
ncbi:MAG: hypothetical protein E6I53_00110 [Chloroflexi bacterium]|nr:MAG: hypothetical protein E6I53_00110 [Chloroflexota bacterium]